MVPGAASRRNPAKNRGTRNDLEASLMEWKVNGRTSQMNDLYKVGELCEVSLRRNSPILINCVSGAMDRLSFSISPQPVLFPHFLIPILSLSLFPLFFQGFFPLLFHYFFLFSVPLVFYFKFPRFSCGLLFFHLIVLSTPNNSKRE